ncbi:MAG: hypothetical protein ACJA06_001301 [Halocynthiibacter sp.]|jgi:hypothetical protein
MGEGIIATKTSIFVGYQPIPQAALVTGMASQMIGLGVTQKPRLLMHIISPIVEEKPWAL